MEPDPPASHSDLGVHHAAIASPLDASRREAEHIDEEVVLRGHVGAGEQGYDVGLDHEPRVAVHGGAGW